MGTPPKIFGGVLGFFLGVQAWRARAASRAFSSRRARQSLRMRSRLAGGLALVSPSIFGREKIEGGSPKINGGGPKNYWGDAREVSGGIP